MSFNFMWWTSNGRRDEDRADSCDLKLLKHCCNFYISRYKSDIWPTVRRAKATPSRATSGLRGPSYSFLPLTVLAVFTLHSYRVGKKMNHTKQVSKFVSLFNFGTKICWTDIISIDYSAAEWLSNKAQFSVIKLCFVCKICTVMADPLEPPPRERKLSLCHL